jgi:xylulokinase
MKDIVIGIDIGTTSAKAIVCDAQGTVLAEASQEYPTHYPHPNWAEQDPEEWWRAACFVLRQILTDRRIDARRIAGVGVSAQAPTIVPVDSAGRPLAMAQLWLDRRGEVECAWLAQTIGEEKIASINGGRIDPYYFAPKLLWIKNHAADILDATRQILLCNGYVIHKLTDAFSLDLSQAPLSLFFDSAKLHWSEKLLEQMGLEMTKLPPLRPCSEIVGEVTPAAAAATGLIAGTPVVAGACDGAAAALEAGVVDVGDAVEMTGQSTVLLISSERPYLGNQLIPLVHAAPGRYLTIGATVASGGALRWFRDTLFLNEEASNKESAFERMTALAATSPIGSNRLIFLPYLYGERSPIWDSAARGVFFGLSLATTQADMIRAVMEGAAFALRHNVEAAAAGGFALKSLGCVGGGAKSALWNQIKADVLNRPLTLPKVGVGAPLGDAMLAAAGVGLHPSVEAAVQTMLRLGGTYWPNATAAVRYEEFYNVYLQLYPQLVSTFHQLATIPDQSIV